MLETIIKHTLDNSLILFPSDLTSPNRLQPSYVASLFCFSVTSRRQFREIITKDVRKTTPWNKPYIGVPSFLLGLDIERRSDPEVIHHLYTTGEKNGPVLPEEGERIARRLDSKVSMTYMECSLDKTDQVEAVLYEVRQPDRRFWLQLTFGLTGFSAGFDRTFSLGKDQKSDTPQN